MGAPRSAAEARHHTRRAEYSVVLVIVVAVLGFSIAGILIGIGDVQARLSRVDVSAVVTMLPLLIWALAFKIARWTVMSEALRVPTPLGRTILYYLAGLTLSLTPARLGETLRLWIIQRCHGYPYARLGPLFIGDRLGDAVSYLCLALLSVAAFLDHAPLVVTCGAVIMLAIGLLLRPRALRALISLAYRILGLQPRVFAALRATVSSSSALLSPQTALGIVILGAAGALGPIAILYLAASQVGIDLTYMQAVFIVALGVLAGGLSMMPGGVGGTEPTMFALLVLARAPPDAALAVVIVQRLIVLWLPAVIGLGALAVSMRLAGAAPALTSPMGGALRPIPLQSQEGSSL